MRFLSDFYLFSSIDSVVRPGMRSNEKQYFLTFKMTCQNPNERTGVKFEWSTFRDVTLITFKFPARSDR